MITVDDIIETNQMISENNLDVRTITMGISLRDCAHPNISQFCQNVYDKITKSAEFLVKTGEDIEAEYGIPIIHKRISVTPIAIAAEACKTDSYVPVAETLDKAAKEVGVNFIGGFSALVEKGETHGDRILINSIPQALASTSLVCSSVNLGSTKAGINMDCVREMGEVIKRTAELTRDQQAIGCAKLVVFANAPGDNPFMAGAFHGVSEAEKVVSVGVSGPGVVKHALESHKGAEASKRLGVPFGIIDLSLAPTPAVGDSVAHIIEEMGIESCGAPGTTAALALLNDAVKKGGLMASSHVGGLSGAFIPVSEDAGMIDAVTRGSLSIEKLEAMTCVCSVGLDMIAIEGDTPASTISAIIADEAAIGMINNKTTAVRVIPVPGKKVGETVEYGGLLGHCPIVPVRSGFSSDAFIARGGRIPAPMRSLTN